MFWRKQEKQAEKPVENSSSKTVADSKILSRPDKVSAQITDAVVDTDAEVLGMALAMSLDQTLLAQSQAQGVLFANMVSEQRDQFEAGQAATIKVAADIYGVSTAQLTGRSS